MDDKSEASSNPSAKPDTSLTREFKLKPVLPLPSFVTRVWVEDNIGNIQNSDIRHISEKCYEWISGWPAVRLDHEAFLDQVHRCLGIPEGIRILKRAFHPKAARKRSVFEPVVERVTALLERTDKEEWRKIRAKPADEVAEFVAAFLRDHDEFELLQEIIFVDLGRGFLRPERIAWVHDVPGLEELSKFTKALAQSQATNSHEKHDANGDTDTTQYSTANSCELASQLNSADQVAAAWTEEIECIRRALDTVSDVPNTDFAEMIATAAQRLTRAVARYQELTAGWNLEVQEAFQRTIDTLKSDPRIANDAMDPATLESSFAAIKGRSLTEERETLLAHMTELATAASKWSDERDTYDSTHNAYVSAPITQRADLLGPMQESLVRLRELSSAMDLHVEAIDELARATGRTSKIVEPDAPMSPKTLEPGLTTAQVTIQVSEPRPAVMDTEHSANATLGMPPGAKAPGVASPSPPVIAVQGWGAVNLLSFKGRYALATFISQTLAETYPTSAGRFRPEIYRLVALAVAAQEIVDVPPEPFRDCCGPLLSHFSDLGWNNSDDDRTILLYLLAGSLFPGLFIPASTTLTVVKQNLVGRFGSAAPRHRIIEHVSDADRFGATLVPEALSQSDQQAYWHRRLQDLQAIARDWRNDEEIYHGFGNFRPAEAAWMAMVDPSRGVIGKAMRAFADAGQRAMNDIRSAAEHLRRTSLEGLLEESGVHRLPQRHIEGRARNNLRHNIEASSAFFERCLRHLQRAPNRSRQAGGTGLDRFTTMLRERTTHARQFLQQQEPRTAAEEAALAAARMAIARLATMFEGYEPPKTDMSLERWFGRELLLIPGLRFSGGWEPDPADPQILLEGAIAFSKECPDNLSAALDHAFKTHRRDGAHVSTGRILVELEHLGFSKAELALRQVARESDVRELRKELSSLQSETRDQINMAIALNLIDDVEKRALETRARGIQVERLPIMDLKADDIPPADRGRGHVAADFPTAREILKGVEKQLDDRFEVARERLKKDVDRLSAEGLAKPLAVDRVNDLLKSRDIVTANEYLRLLRDAQDLPADTHRNATLRAFIYDFLPRLEQTFSTNRQKITDIALDVLAQTSASMPGLFDVAEMSAPQRDDASRMLLAWRDIRTATSGLGDAIQRLFAGGLSFDVKQVDDQREKGGSIFRFHLSTARLVVPDGFVVPLFGSEANGNYLVEVIRGQPKTIELFQQMQGEAARQRATFHLFANLIGSQDRRDLAERAHNLGYQGMVLDDALIAFLAFERGNRLAALFRIASAFIRYNPYNEVTPLPPEMFYGRVELRSQIVSRRGGSLVFGGRRLGKSSLLRDVERKDHRPNEDVFVKCVDIHDIGQTEEYASRLWHRLASELNMAGVNIRKDSTQADSVVADIRAFLREKASRRLLLMLDEADNFLAAEEEKKYENLVRLRQILEETEDRFKVVMAGLHNVQRTATRPNQSLGHFGTPVCIGPFVGNDRYEGLKLVAEPMATLGFEFETSTLPLRILSQTNYYPALVQLYCRELLNHLCKTNREGQEGPPFKITAGDLDVAYKSQNLSEEINKRFRLTLDLDDRYKLIALVIANAAIEQSDLGTVPRPMTPEQVARHCLHWCPALFENKTPSAFLALLEELVGLGVLAQQGREGFVLRSPNIVTMLGSADSIAEELLHFDSREPPGPDRSAQRRVLDDDRGIPSPLTPAQEHRLLETDSGRVSIVLASMATGLENVEKAVQSVTHQLFERSLDRGRVQSPDELLRKIVSPGRESVRENRLVLVPFEVGWTLPWIRRVNSVSEDLAQRHIRIMFIGGPSHARTLAEESALAEEIDIESAELWTETTLRSYLAERERKDCDIPELRPRMLQASGLTGEGMRYLLNAIGNKGERFETTRHARLCHLQR